MTSIKNISVKVAGKTDGTVYSYIPEISVEYDGWPLTNDQVRQANELLDQLRGVQVNVIKRWVSEDKTSVQDQSTATVPANKESQRDAKIDSASEAPTPTPQPNRIDTPPYDEVKKRWNYCEAHPDEEIKHYNKEGKVYFACFKCANGRGEFLQSDGTRKPMGGKG